MFSVGRCFLHEKTAMKNSNKTPSCFHGRIGYIIFIFRVTTKITAANSQDRVLKFFGGVEAQKYKVNVEIASLLMIFCQNRIED